MFWSVVIWSDIHAEPKLDVDDVDASLASELDDVCRCPAYGWNRCSRESGRGTTLYGRNLPRSFLRYFSSRSICASGPKMKYSSHLIGVPSVGSADFGSKGSKRDVAGADEVEAGVEGAAEEGAEGAEEGAAEAAEEAGDLERTGTCTATHHASASAGLSIWERRNLSAAGR